jgi:hypothetical protein
MTPMATTSADRSAWDYRDLVIEDFADTEAALLADLEHWATRALMAEREGETYRLLAGAAIHHAHDSQQRLVVVEGRYHRALDEARRLRAALRQHGDGRAA